MHIKKTCLIFLLILAINLFSEEFDTVKKPVKAGLLSLAIPGGGQIYNEQYIKSGIVLGLDAYLIGMAYYNEEKRTDFKRKLKNATDPAEIEYCSDQVDEYYKRRQSDYWWIGTTVFLSMMDAYVDAHLYNFDIKKKEIDLRFKENKLTLSYKF
jgi:hypothetical protein